MAKVTLAPFIESISGKVGNLQFRTLKSGRTVVHARRDLIEGTPLRSTPLSEAEKAHRKKFGMVSSITAQIQEQYARIDQAARDRKAIWQKVTYLYNKLKPEIEDDNLLREQILEQYKAKNLDTKTGF